MREPVAVQDRHLVEVTGEHPRHEQASHSSSHDEGVPAGYPPVEGFTLRVSEHNKIVGVRRCGVRERLHYAAMRLFGGSCETRKNRI